MNLYSILSTVGFQFFSESANVAKNWIVNIVDWMISGIGIVIIGIIIFSLCLSLITLPLDIYAKVSSKKMNLKMEEMKPQLEKYKKQYANNQQLYQQKVMEVQKAQGVSMLKSCLPLIVTLIIFIVVINAFQSYSQFTNIELYNNMIKAYNTSLIEYTVPNDSASATVDGDYTFYTTENDKEFICYKVKNGSSVKEYYIDIDKLIAYDSDGFNAILNNKYHDNIENVDIDITNYVDAATIYVKNIGRKAAQEEYNVKSKEYKGLIVKNIWYSDTAYTHPVANYSKFKSSISNKIAFYDTDGKLITKQKLSKIDKYNSKQSDPNKKVSFALTENVYNEITFNLTKEKSSANGYFVLVVLSGGIMFLSQFLTMKMQKTSNEMQTLNGQGQSTQKIMMVVMSGVIVLTGFLYSAAFCIYNMTRTIFSITTSLITNKVIDYKFSKEEERKLTEKYSRRIPKYTKK